MNLYLILLLIAGLLIIIGLIQPLASRLGFSSSVLLALIGVAIGVTCSTLTRSHGFPSFTIVAKQIVNLPIHSDAFLYIFLPLLLFETALNIEVQRIIEDAAPILLLAVVAVVIATVVIGAVLDTLASVPPVACFLLGSIVATTDPVAVIDIFRDVGAPARLRRLVEGESLFNDAAAITLFVLLLGILENGHRPSIWQASLAFVFNFAGGLATGYFGARLILALIRRLIELRLAQVTLTLALPYLVYITGERLFGVSGVVATVTAGLVMSALGQPHMSPDDWRFLHDLWEQIAFWAGSLIFIFASLLVPRMLEHVGWHDVQLLLVLVFAALAARALVLFAILPLLSALKFSQKVETRFKIVIMWGGLRGAVTLALALAVTENSTLSLEIRRFVGVLATGFVLFTLLVNGTTLRMLIHLLGLDLLSPFDEALRKQVLASSRDRISEAVKSMAIEYKLPKSLISDAVTNRSAQDLAAAPATSMPREDLAQEYRIVLGLIALSSHEREIVLRHFAERTVSGRIVEESLAGVGQLIDRTRAGGLLEYIGAAQRMVDFSRYFRIAHFLHRHFLIDRALVDGLADRFELLLFHAIVLSELERYLAEKLPPLVGQEASVKLGGVLRQRIEMTTAALDALRQQYPAYAQLLERRILNKIWLRREEMEYRALFEDGIVGPELYSALRRETTLVRSRVNERPRLDLGLETRALISQVPIFATLTREAHDALARLLRPRFAVPGERLIRDGDAADAMYFLSSGTADVHVANTRFTLGAGDFFGEMGLVTGQRRQGDVYAISYCQLLVLRDADFQRLLRGNPGLQEQIDAVTSERIREDQLARTKPAI